MTETTQQPGDKKFRTRDIPYYLFATLAALSAVGFVLFIVLTLHYSVTHVAEKTIVDEKMVVNEKTVTLKEGIEGMLYNISHWFDGIFFQYNLLLLSIAVAIPPLITLFYVVGMREEKKRRLKLEIPEALFKNKKYNIDKRIKEIFSMRHYLGSMPMLTVIVLMGGMIILLLLLVQKRRFEFDFA